MQKRQKVKKTELIKLKLVLILAFSIAVVGIYFVGKYAVANLASSKLSRIELNGDFSYQIKDEIYSIVAKDNTSDFYSLDLAKLKRMVNTLPWVKQVNLTRVWPSTLNLFLIEHKPIAWLAEGGLVSSELKVFYPTTTAKSLSNLELPKLIVAKKDVSKACEQLFFIQSKIKPLDFKLKELQLMSDQGWRALLEPKINLYLGSSDFETKLNNFMVAYKHKLRFKLNKIAYIDLRYTNGIAVGWK